MTASLPRLSSCLVIADGFLSAYLSYMTTIYCELSKITSFNTHA